MVSKLLFLLMLAAILFSLGTALYHLVKDDHHSTGTVRALTWRTLLSITLFIAVLLAFGAGMIKPHPAAFDSPPVHEQKQP